MSFHKYKPYESVADRKIKAEKMVKKLRKKNPDISPVTIEGKSLVNTWWGKSWNKNLESYADYKSRISRGKSYVKNGAVLDLKITKGTVEALVLGSGTKPYEIIIEVEPLSAEKWDEISKLCKQQISSLEDLIGGKFPKSLEVIFLEQQYGLFPSPDEITFSCSCPDWAYMCKHVASVLYGIGSRLDQDPMLFFELRDVDSQGLIKKTMEKKLESMLSNTSSKSNREIKEEDIFDIFGI